MPDYVFQLIPFERLSTTQQAAVVDENAIALSGGPGTGKSMVSLWRHILNHRRETPVNSSLLTFTTSLALYLKRCCQTESPEAASNVQSSIRWITNEAKTQDEIIHDEAQDISIEKNSCLKKYTDKISYGADNQQLITAFARNADGTYNTAKCSPEEKLQILHPNNSLHTLSVNHRNSKKIILLAQKLFHNAAIPREIVESCTTDGEFPRLLIVDTDEKNDQTVLQLVRSYNNDGINIGILVPFERPNFQAGDTATAQHYHNLLTNAGYDCSIYTNSMGGCTQLKNIHITTFKSSKGMEFDVVILPDFHLYNVTFNVVNWHDYYVGLTRTKSNLFLLSRKNITHLQDNGNNKVIDRVIV
ncbi:hypothetical protein A9168_01690 [Macellibacteroides sp. HH-ZS]|nr:hypothetical protein A9168_01690 [Macellibacteroides sp. HH-ZS]